MPLQYSVLWVFWPLHLCQVYLKLFCVLNISLFLNLFLYFDLLNTFPFVYRDMPGGRMMSCQSIWHQPPRSKVHAIILENGSTSHISGTTLNESITSGVPVDQTPRSDTKSMVHMATVILGFLCSSETWLPSAFRLTDWQNTTHVLPAKFSRTDNIPGAGALILLGHSNGQSCCLPLRTETLFHSIATSGERKNSLGSV